MADSPTTIVPKTEEEVAIEVPRPDVSHLVTEDDSPVDNWFSEKQQRLLTEPLYASWEGPPDDPRFIAAANVGLYAGVRQAPIVPDVFLSLGVDPPDDFWEKGKRVYFFWEFGKPPDVVIEIVSNTIGNEGSSKVESYSQMRVPFYVIFDPLKQIQDEALKVYASAGPRYEEVDQEKLFGIGLGLTLWSGLYEGVEDTWLRWQDAEGNLILTGKERSERELQRAIAEKERADAAESKAERLAEQLRKMGIDPDTL